MPKDIRYVTNTNGDRIAVILAIEDYENLLEDLHVLSAAYESRNDPGRPFDDVLDEMRAAAEIDV